MGINFHPKHCSYIPLLLMALSQVEGDVLELGTGPISTRLLHWICFDCGRQLVSLENSKSYYSLAAKCQSDFHVVQLVEDWDDADIERQWGMVLVDHAPASRRKVEAARLANYAQVLLLHDTQWQQEKHYDYKSVIPMFRYKYTYNKCKPHTTAVSNFVDVSQWAQIKLLQS